MDDARNPIAGLQYAATAFYVIAVVHGLSLHRRDGGRCDTRERAWTPAYAAGMIVAFVAGSRRTGDRGRRARVTVLLVLLYGLLRISAAVTGCFEGAGRHRRAAAAEGTALLLAYALASAAGSSDRGPR